MDHDTSHYQLKTAIATVKWKKVKNATKYQVYKKVGRTGTWKRIGTTKKLSYADKKVKIDKTYYYKVRAIKSIKGKSYYGCFSADKKVTMKLYKVFGIKFDPDAVIKEVKNKAKKNYPDITYENYPLKYKELYSQGKMTKDDYDIYKSCDENNDGILTVQEDGFGYQAVKEYKYAKKASAIESLYWDFEYSVVGARDGIVRERYSRYSYSLSWRYTDLSKMANDKNGSDLCVAFYIWR